MAFPPKLLNDGEEIVLDLRPHWLFMALSSGVFLAVIVAGLGLLAWNSGGTNWEWFETSTRVLSLGAFLFCLAWFLITYARWNTTHFVLTTDRIINREGVISKRGTDIPLDRVNTVLFSQGPLERLVGAGDLTVESASETGANHFENVRKPNVVQKEIYVQMEANEDRKFGRMRGPNDGHPAPVDATKAHTIPEQIDQLSELHQRGVLSDAEFARKKAELLDRM
ncbi:MAG: hypothetical protein JWO77_3229 [Ilumatobacteraceae bacterium]|nr:hypothetical protein [Ilumatobacteraceae bacterium]